MAVKKNSDLWIFDPKFFAHSWTRLLFTFAVMEAKVFPPSWISCDLKQYDFLESFLDLVITELFAKLITTNVWRSLGHIMLTGHVFPSGISSFLATEVGPEEVRTAAERLFTKLERITMITTAVYATSNRC